MRKATVILLLLAFCNIVIMSQGYTSITSNKRYKTFQIGAIGSLDMCFRTLENKERESSVQSIIDSRNNTETFKFGYSGGLGFSMNVTEHFGMETGILYTNRGYETRLMNYIYITPDPSLPEQGRSIYNYNFIEVPVKANFFAGRNKVRFFCSFGINTNILVAQNETFVKKYADGRTEYDVFKTDFDFQKVVFSGSLAAGLDIKFNNYLNLRVYPTFSHQFGKFMDAYISEYLWNTGLTAAFYYGWY